MYDLKHSYYRCVNNYLYTIHFNTLNTPTPGHWLVHVPGIELPALTLQGFVSGARPGEGPGRGEGEFRQAVSPSSMFVCLFCHSFPITLLSIEFHGGSIKTCVTVVCFNQPLKQISHGALRGTWLMQRFPKTNKTWGNPWAVPPACTKWNMPLQMDLYIQLPTVGTGVFGAQEVA